METSLWKLFGRDDYDYRDIVYALLAWHLYLLWLISGALEYDS